jgi:ribosomal protein L37AE/L43A
MNCPYCGAPMVISAWDGWVWMCFHCDHQGRLATDEEIDDDEA